MRIIDLARHLEHFSFFWDFERFLGVCRKKWTSGSDLWVMMVRIKIMIMIIRIIRTRIMTMTIMIMMTMECFLPPCAPSASWQISPHAARLGRREYQQRNQWKRISFHSKSFFSLTWVRAWRPRREQPLHHLLNVAFHLLLPVSIGLLQSEHWNL